VGLGILTKDPGAVPGTMGDALPALNLGAGRTARSITLGYGTSCAVLDDGGVACWGEQADPSLLPVRAPLPATPKLKSLLPSGKNIAALLDDGTFVPNVLAPGSASFLGTRKAKAVFGTVGQTCAKLENDTFVCQETKFLQQQVPAGAASDVVDLALGGTTFSFALFADGSVKARGIPTTNGFPPPYWRMGPEQPDGWLAVSLGQRAKAITASGGNFLQCALLEDGRVKCWGPHCWQGSVGGPDCFDVIDEVGVGSSVTLAWTQGSGPEPTTIDWQPIDLGTRPPSP
jgi:hypothetical protein